MDERALPFLHHWYTASSEPRGPAPATAPSSGAIPVPTLTTARLVLRDWRDDDLPAFRALNADAEVMRFFPSTLSADESDALAKRVRAHLAREGFGLWAVSPGGSNELLGMVGLARVSFDAAFTPAVEVAWRLKRSAWGQGLATEAARAAVAFGFTALGLSHLVSFTVPANQPSRRVMEKLGFRHDAAEDFLHPRLPAGHPLRLHVLYRLPYEAWARGRRLP
ncbi:MAG: GNAT family N-acetyltransferase [Myxococcaceae bacterium]|nr:GNAT family N-acetyltransferase [Myxococcaceae bacterium]